VRAVGKLSTYLECREGGTSKFWAAQREGKALHVHWGRIGTAGQQQVKQFPSPAEAKAELERWVAEKQKKGYGPPEPRSAPAPKGTPSALEEVCAAIEAYCAKLPSVEGLEVSPAELAPAKASDIAAFEKQWKVKLPEDVRAFLRRGLRYVDGSTLGDDGAYIGFDFMSLKSMASTMKLYQGLLEHYDEDENEDEYELLSHGVALSYSEPQLVVHCGPGRDTGAIYHFSTRNPLRPPIAGSLTEFLQHWLAAGCFSSHRFSALWPHVQRLVPVKLSRKQNRWLRYYDAQFPQFLR
jgi:predicted DNA-binding WGR domain protein